MYGDYVVVIDQFVVDDVVFEEFWILVDDQDVVQVYDEDDVEEVGNEIGGVQY